MWRADRPQKGRFREFYQCDVDATGSTSMTVEAELLAAGAEVLTRLGFTDFAIRLNHRQLLTAVLDAAGVPAALHGTALVSLDKADKIGRDAVVDETGRRAACRAAAADALVETLFAPRTAGGAGNAATLDPGRRVRRRRRRRRRGGRPAARDPDAGGAARRPARTCSIDPTLARGLGYYTGAIFEIAVADLAGSARRRRPLRRPGRHVPRPARAGLRAVARTRAHPGGDGGARHVPGGGRTAAGRRAGGQLRRRRRGRRRWRWRPSCAPAPTAPASPSRSIPDVDKLGKQFKYAAERGVPFVAVMGEAERRRRHRRRSRRWPAAQQVVVPRDAAAAHIVSAMRTSRG